MANTFTEFNLTDGQEAERKLLKTFVNVASSGTPEWELIGDGIEESSIEYNTDTETSTDILGQTRTKVNKTEPAQSFEPYTVRGGSKLAFILWDIYRRNAVSELTQFKVLVVHEFVGSSTGYAAEHRTTARSLLHLWAVRLMWICLSAFRTATKRRSAKSHTSAKCLLSRLTAVFNTEE